MKKAKKIIFILPGVNLGGAEQATIRIINGLILLKYEIILLNLNNNKIDLINEVDQRVVILNGNYKTTKSSIIFILYQIFKHKPDIVFTNFWHLNSLMGFLRYFFWFRKIKFIGRETNIPSERIKNYRYKFIASFCYFHIIPKLDVIVCQSKKMFDDLLINYRINVNKLKLINNPISIDSCIMKSKLPFEKNDTIDRIRKLGSKILVSIGRFDDIKSQHLSIEAINILRNENIFIVFIGDGIKLEANKLLVQKLNLQDKVLFLGTIVNPFPILSLSDGLILTSKSEGYPNVVLEALCLEKKIICTPSIGGLLEIIENKPGCFISKSFDPIDIAKAIKFAINSSISPNRHDFIQLDSEFIFNQFVEIL